MPPEDAQKIERTLRYSIADGIGYSVMVGAGETYFIPYAIFLGASNLVLGLLVALPIFLGSLSQVLSEKLLRVLGSRKRLISLAVAVQVLTFAPIILVPSFRGYESPLILAGVCAYWIFGMVLGPSWSSLMGDLVEEDRRGAYFGRRNAYIQISIFLSLAAAGLILYFFKRAGMEYAGFAFIFGIAVAARLVSLFFLLLHHDPPVSSPPHGRALSMVVETFRDRDQRMLILYFSLMSFGVYLAAPYFSAYMLRPPERHGLAWSYATYTGIIGIAMVCKFLFLPLWGRASDRFGARKCLILSSWIVTFLPLFWLAPPSSPVFQIAMICTAQIAGGFSWAGYELCSFNFLLDSGSAEVRPRLVASMNIVNGIGIFLGSSAGALVVSVLGGWLQPYLWAFFLSSVARILVCIALLHRLREVRQVERCSYRSLFFRVSGVRLSLGPVMRFFLIPGKRVGLAQELFSDTSKGP